MCFFKEPFLETAKLSLRKHLLLTLASLSYRVACVSIGVFEIKLNVEKVSDVMGMDTNCLSLMTIQSVKKPFVQIHCIK